MRVTRARVQKYRSIRDSGWFGVEHAKTILVGPNEAGKTVLLRALQHINPGPLVKPFDPLRDYPRSEYQDIPDGRVEAKGVQVVEAEFELDDDDKEAVRAISPALSDCRYWRSTTLDNSRQHRLLDGPSQVTVGSLKDNLRKLAAHADRQMPQPAEGAAL